MKDPCPDCGKVHAKETCFACIFAETLLGSGFPIGDDALGAGFVEGIALGIATCAKLGPVSLCARHSAHLVQALHDQGLDMRAFVAKAVRMDA